MQLVHKLALAIPFFLNENCCILIRVPLEFVPKDPVNYNPAFGSDYGLAPNRRQAIIWINHGRMFSLSYFHYIGSKQNYFTLSTWYLECASSLQLRFYNLVKCHGAEKYITCFLSDLKVQPISLYFVFPKVNVQFISGVALRLKK